MPSVRAYFVPTVKTADEVKSILRQYEIVPADVSQTCAGWMASYSLPAGVRLPVLLPVIPQVDAWYVGA